MAWEATRTPRSPCDVEAALAGRRFVERLHLRDDGATRAGPTPCHQGVDGGRGALEDRLDAPIIAIADPPGHLPLAGRAGATGPEENPLYLAGDDHSDASHPTMLPRRSSIRSTGGPVPIYDERTALLIVDVQNDFADAAGGLYVQDGEAVIPVVNRLVTAARSADRKSVV